MQDSQNDITSVAQTGSNRALLIFLILSVPLLYFPTAFMWGSRTALSISFFLGLLVVLIVLSKYPKGALYALLCYLPFSGTVTSALGSHPSLGLVKDAFYLIALIGVIRICRREKHPIILPEAIKAPLGLVFSLGILTIAFTNLPDQIQGIDGPFPIVMGLWGLKVLLGYVPLMACTYYLIRTEKDFYSLMRLQVVLILIACTLGAIQFLLLKTGICAGTQGLKGEELYRATLNARCFVGGSLLYSPDIAETRLPGTFLAPWQWGWFLTSSIFFSFCTAFKDKARLWRALGATAIVAAVALGIISGQHLTTLLVLPSVLFLMAITGQIINLKQFIPISLLLGGVLLYLIVSNPSIPGNDTGSWLSQWQHFSPHAFLQAQFSDVWQGQKGFFGHGLGRATNSARIYGKTILLETYHPKLLYELGPWGLMSVLVMYATVVFSTFQAYRATQNKRLKIYAASLWSFVLLISICPFYYPLDVEPVNIYFWLAAGLTLKLPQLSELSELSNKN